ncbi:hypothetical protein [Burkholderia phage vB_BglM_WTB]
MIETNAQAVARLGLTPLTATQLVILHKARAILEVTSERNWESYICNAISLAARAAISNSEHAAREAAQLRDLVEDTLRTPGAKIHTLGSWLVERIESSTGYELPLFGADFMMKFNKLARLAWVDRMIELEAI